MAHAVSDTSSQLLKAELKTWERSFAAANDGRKPGRSDIAADPVIAAKYKEYDALFRSRKQAGGEQGSKPQAPNLPQATEFRTPRKAKRSIAQAAKSPIHVLSPTPQAVRIRLGPTPQKDGLIIGLFDVLPVATPSKTRTVLAPIDENVALTPIRRGSVDIKSDEAERIRLSRTPTSSGKRYMLDSFATPQKRKRDDIATTPSERRGLETTPQFLRQSRFKSAGETDAKVNLARPESRALPFAKRSMVRSLSSIIRDLRGIEESRYDDDLEALREAEGGIQSSTPKIIDKSSTATADDQHAEMPLGPDMPDVSSEDSEVPADSLGKDGKPRKVWKKKGQKRTTRKVKMRPAARPAHPVPTSDEVRNGATPVGSSMSAHPKDEDSDFSDDSDDSIRKASSLSAVSSKKKRKVNELAHTNFCKLKIKNKNSKANGRGRFGRR